MKNKYPTVLLAIASLVIIMAGVIFAKNIITLFLMAIFMGIILLQPIRWLQSKKVPQSFSIIIAFILIVTIFFGFGKIINNSLVSISKDIPKYQQSYNEIETNFFIFLNEKGIDLSPEKLEKNIDSSKLIGITTNILSDLGSLLGRSITILILMLFLLFEKNSLALKVKAISKSTGISLPQLKYTGKNIRHYLAIKTITSLLTGVLIWVSLEIIGLEHALLWGLIAFLLNYIPTIGSFTAAVPAVLFALITISTGGVLWTIIIFVIVNLLVGSFIEPKAMGKGMGISTFIVFAGLFFWGFLLGTVGMFLSVPLTMAIKNLLALNENTRWMAVIIGTEDDALKIISKDKI